MNCRIQLRYVVAFILCSLLISISGCSSPPQTPFDTTALVDPGDSVRYGSYIVEQIDDGIYKINDPGVTTGILGAWGVDMYLVRGADKALLIDIGNNYIEGFEKDLIDPRENAAQEFRDVIFGLIGNLPLEVAPTHAHPDHLGMAAALADQENVTFWISEAENLDRFQAAHNVDQALFNRYTTGEKEFDLGGGRIVETFLIKGHSDGHAAMILRKDKILFGGDAIGNGTGMTFSALDRLEIFAEYMQKLVDHIEETFAPYERYALKVFVGHSWITGYNGFYNAAGEKADVGYLDWRYLQNMASCANGIFEGKWLDGRSGLRYVGDMPAVDYWPQVEGYAIMLDGLGAVVLPIELAYEAAGLEMPG